ncbi:MAG TPA: metalloregulator ArsR/SmtB family transcription factor [Candidatus Baltobacteraceae bacterium]|jgi:DNA-binding transcriptional ArsR family regulator|nr:metalloregulator ArsR/SmtB family transcription factor [Candidatus Baltobacteraceae bacterium]
MAKVAARAKAPEVAPSDEVLAKFMRGLGDPTRLRIIRYLLDGPRTVGEMVAHLRAPQSRVSNHLACLKWCGYVATERRGRSIAYRVADPRVRVVIELAREIAGDNAEQVANCMRIVP